MSEGLQIDTPITGHCLCGAVVITLRAAGTRIDVCHCTMCLAWGGGPFAGLSAEDVVVDGEASVTTFRSSDWAERAFCRTCGSHLWYRFLPADHYSFLAGLFDLPRDFAIHRQIFVDEKPHWYDLAQETPMMTGAQIVEEAKAMGYSFE